MAAAAITGFLMLVVLEILRNAFNHLTGRAGAARHLAGGLRRHGGDDGRSTWSSCATSRAEAKRLGSEMLLADALQTRGDVWTSLAVIAALAGARAGVPILDPIAALVVAGFIGYAGFQIATATTRILSDRIVMSEADLERVVMSVPGVLGCHHIRTRGVDGSRVPRSARLAARATCALTDAHDLSHVVKDRLMARYPQIVGRDHPHRAAAARTRACRQTLTAVEDC